MPDSKHGILRWFFTLLQTHYYAQTEVYGRIHQPILTPALFEACLEEAMPWVTFHQPDQWAIGTVDEHFLNGQIRQTALSSLQGLLVQPLIPSDSRPLAASTLHQLIATERLFACGRSLAARVIFLHGGLSPLIEAEFIAGNFPPPERASRYPAFADLGNPDDPVGQDTARVAYADQLVLHPLVRAGYRSTLYEALSLNAIWLRHGFTLGWNPQRTTFTRPSLVEEDWYRDPDQMTTLLAELLLHRVVCAEAIYHAIRSCNDRESDPTASALQWTLAQHRASFDDQRWLCYAQPSRKIFNTITTIYQGALGALHPQKAELSDHQLIDSASATPTLLNADVWRAIMRYHVLKSLGRMLGARWLFQTGGIARGDERQWNPLTDTRVTNSTGFPVEPWVLTNAIVGFGYREAVIEMCSCIQLFRTYGAHRSWSVPAPSRDTHPSS